MSEFYFLMIKSKEIFVIYYKYVWIIKIKQSPFTGNWTSASPLAVYEENKINLL